MYFESCDWFVGLFYRHCVQCEVLSLLYIAELMSRRGMKLIDIENSEGSLACQIFCLPRAIPASEKIPEFGDLQEHCIITIVPPISL